MATLITQNTGAELVPLNQIGQDFNKAASLHIILRYRQGKAKNTLRTQDNDLAKFALFLTEQSFEVDNLNVDPRAWAGITWGLVEGFKQWQLKAGYAISTINRRLATIKVYCGLVSQAGVISESDYMMIVKQVKSFKRTEGRHIDAQREQVDIPTRYEQPGAKKSQPVSLTKVQAGALKSQPDTPQGRRDSLLMCLLLDHGLRCGEVARLQVSDFDLKEKELRFYRPKVDKVQTHTLSRDTLRAARAYFKQDALPIGPLLRASLKSGELAGSGMSERAITKRVKVLGQAIGVEGLSAHDLRHYWATLAARNKTPLDRLQEAGGWSSHAMPLRYIEDAKIANEGVILD